MGPGRYTRYGQPITERPSRRSTPKTATTVNNTQATTPRLKPNSCVIPGEDHETLDEAVAAAYGWPADISDEDILRELLTLNGG